jgi:hypothetical protein
MPCFLITRRELSLGTQDPVTGWYGKTFTDSTGFCPTTTGLCSIHGIVDSCYDKMAIAPKGASLAQYGVGSYAKYPYTGIICAPLKEDDEVIAGSYYYRVGWVQPVKAGDSHICYVCELLKREMPGDRPATSGTWHLDSDAVRTDPRNRIKTVLDDNLTVANIKEDDGATNATYITQFSDPDYHLKRVFITKAVDVILSVGKTAAKAKPDYIHKPYAFEETVPIDICAVDKAGLTATNVVEQAEQEIRHVLTDYYAGSIRSIESVKHAPVDIGEMLMWKTTVTVKYTRPNDEYVPTAPAFDREIGYVYEGDRVVGGEEGTWGKHEDGNTITFPVDSENNLDLIVSNSAGNKIAYVHNGTDLVYSSTVYPKVRGRYKTSNLTIKAKVVLEFSTWNDGNSEAVNIAAGFGQEVLAEASSLTWTVFTADVDLGNTIANIRLYANGEKTDTTATVYYDFIELYQGDYILPNVLHMSPPMLLQEANIPIPGRMGTVNQPLGSGDMEVKMTCDLDMEHTNLLWRRPQTVQGTTVPPKSDYNNIDTLMATLQNCGVDVNWVWLDLGSPAMQFKARLVEVTPALEGEGNVVELLWREYRHGSASTETAAERFGTSL